ncbi:porin family protein [Labilibacter marinus]|uniref:porin family protein n=1 Tax=Labilibacter marinus TaxID=1477105 RepID=UPI00094F887B|nr:porin family protein [Labilibacter marinus]
MSKIYTLIILCAILIPTGIMGQEKSKEKTRDIIIIDDTNNRATVGIAGAKIEVDEQNDTIAKITIGRRRWEFIETYGDTKVRTVKVPRDDFKGHWAGVQLGFNNYIELDQEPWMSLNSGKSMTFGINFLQYSIGLQQQKNNIGLVTGMGWAVYNYRFDNDWTIEKDENGNTIGVPAEPNSVKKSKIVASYINIPLLFEVQSGDKSKHDAFFSAGVYGGFNLGSHTKTVYYDSGKTKSRKDININPFQYGVMVQMGINFIKLYGTYNFSTLYERNKGPEVTPFTVGLTLLNF